MVWRENVEDDHPGGAKKEMMATNPGGTRGLSSLGLEIQKEI